MGHEGHDHGHHHGDGAGAHADPHGTPHGHHHGVDTAESEGYEPTRTPLARGAGKGKLLYFDAPSGLAGDMIVAALIDLGVPRTVVDNAVEALRRAESGLGGFHLHWGRATRSGIVATTFDVHVDAPSPERSWADIRSLLERANLEPDVRELALRSFRRLAESESKVHRMPIDAVHFHEVGAVDSIVDMVAAAAALNHLGATVGVSPLPMGRGFVRARHGVLPLPAPATVECLRGFATVDGGVDAELVTPTGAAIVAAHGRSMGWPAFEPEFVGWGAGARELADRPNVLRAILGAPWPAPWSAPGEGSRVGGSLGEPFPSAGHVIVETNIDDATGELLAACMTSLREAGALDVWATPALMKKGRPGHVLSALATLHHAPAVAQTMIRESTSLGVRMVHAARLERPRRVIQVETRFGMLPVKVSEGPFGPPQVKPEFDPCAAAAKRHGVTVREVIQEALAEALRALSTAAATAT